MSKRATTEREEAVVRVNPAVKARRTNPNATRVVDMTMEQLMTDDGVRPVLYVPASCSYRMLRLYGGHTMLDFDELYDVNTKIGAPLPTATVK